LAGSWFHLCARIFGALLDNLTIWYSVDGHVMNDKNVLKWICNSSQALSHKRWPFSQQVIGSWWFENALVCFCHLHRCWESILDVWIGECTDCFTDAGKFIPAIAERNERSLITVEIMYRDYRSLNINNIWNFQDFKIWFEFDSDLLKF
jgi:hypothetical protein